MPQPRSWRVQVWGEWRDSACCAAASCRSGTTLQRSIALQVSQVYQAASSSVKRRRNKRGGCYGLGRSGHLSGKMGGI